MDLRIWQVVRWMRRPSFNLVLVRDGLRWWMGGRLPNCGLVVGSGRRIVRWV